MCGILTTFHLLREKLISKVSFTELRAGGRSFCMLISANNTSSSKIKMLTSIENKAVVS